MFKKIKSNRESMWLQDFYILIFEGAGKQKSTTTTTKKAAVTTKKSSDSKDEADSIVVASTTKSIKENDACAFKGLMPDNENCQSKIFEQLILIRIIYLSYKIK